MPNSEKTNDDPWIIDPDYPLADWVQEVTNDDTRLGYLAWVDHQKAALEDYRPPYTVLVGNIGHIDCATLEEAEETYAGYVILSKGGASRAGNEPVTLLQGADEILKEHTPPCIPT